MSLPNDIRSVLDNDGYFDAVICLGNSFAHMMDESGEQKEQKHAITNFMKCLKPGGLLLIDHRNYDHILDTGDTPTKCIYYNVCIMYYPLKDLVEVLHIEYLFSEQT